MVPGNGKVKTAGVLRLRAHNYDLLHARNDDACRCGKAIALVSITLSTALAKLNVLSLPVDCRCR